MGEISVSIRLSPFLSFSLLALGALLAQGAKKWSTVILGFANRRRKINGE